MRYRVLEPKQQLLGAAAVTAFGALGVGLILVFGRNGAGGSSGDALAPLYELGFLFAFGAVALLGLFGLATQVRHQRTISALSARDDWQRGEVFAVTAMKNPLAKVAGPDAKGIKGFVDLHLRMQSGEHVTLMAVNKTRTFGAVQPEVGATILVKLSAPEAGIAMVRSLSE